MKVECFKRGVNYINSRVFDDVRTRFIDLFAIKHLVTLWTLLVESESLRNFVQVGLKNYLLPSEIISIFKTSTNRLNGLRRHRYHRNALSLEGRA